jgi:dienelactone hydrolase
MRRYDMQYREEKCATNKYKQEYLDGINRVIEQRQREAREKRKEYIKDVFEDSERYREDLKSMLGWPLVDHTANGLPSVRTETLSKEDGYTVIRMQAEILDGLWMTGLFFKLDTDTPKPMVIMQHGGLGTPELMAGVYGSTTNLNDMLQRTLRFGVHIFAPQLLLWDDKKQHLVPFDRRATDARLKRVGSSVTALEIYGIQRVIDYFEAQSFVTNFGMIGLSYGGFYTLFTTAVETRIKSAISAIFFNTRDAYDWLDWTWQRSAERFDDAEVAALIYPRKLCIRIADKDELFDPNGGVTSFERLCDMCSEVGTDWVDFDIFEGKHEFFRDDAPIERLVADISK